VCSEASLPRKRLKHELANIRLSLKLLLHTKLGIEKTLEYIVATGVATRKWHQERSEESEEEEEEGEERGEEERE